MAIELKQFDPEQDNQNNESAGQGSNPQLSSPEAPTVGGSQGGVVTPGAGPTNSGGTSSGRFNNLRKYLAANKDFQADKGGLAGSIVGNINQQAQNVQKNVQGAQQGFQRQAEEQVKAFTNPELVNQAFQNPTGFVSGFNKDNSNRTDYRPNQNVIGSWTPEQQETYTNIIGQQHPMDVGPNSANAASLKRQQEDLQKFYSTVGYQTPILPPTPSNLEAFAKIRDAQYTGPKSLQDLSGEQNLAKLQVQAGGVNDLVKQGQSEAGRFNLLKSMYGKPTYTAGQQNLDNLFLQSNKDQLNKIQGTRQLATNTNRQLAQAEQAAQQQAQQAQAQAATTQADVRGQLNKGVTNWESALQEQVGAAKLKQQEAANKFTDQLKAGYISPEDLARFQTSYPEFKEGMETYGADLSGAVSTAGNLTPQTVASKADYDKIAALKQLIGNTASEQASGVLANYNDPTLAGSFAAGPQYNLDTNVALGKIAARKADYDTQAAEIQRQQNLANAALSQGGYGTGIGAGGLMGEAAKRAIPLRQQAEQKQQQEMLAAKNLNTEPKPYVDYSKMSDMDVIKQFGPRADDTASFINPEGVIADTSGNVYRDIISQILAQQQKQAQYTDKYNKLQNMFQIGRKLTTDPTKADLSAGLTTASTPVLSLPTGPVTFTPSGPTPSSGLDEDGNPIRVH